MIYATPAHRCNDHRQFSASELARRYRPQSRLFADKSSISRWACYLQEVKLPNVSSLAGVDSMDATCERAPIDDVHGIPPAFRETPMQGGATKLVFGARSFTVVFTWRFPRAF